MEKPTFDYNQLKIGSVFYQVENHPEFFNNPRIYKEFDGEIWYRYEKPKTQFVVNTYTIIGILTKTLDGAWPDDMAYELSKEFYIVDQTGFNQTVEDYWFEDGDFFVDKDEAECYKDNMNSKAHADDLASRRKVE